MNAPGTFLVKAADIDRARLLTRQFFIEYHLNMLEDAERYFPDRLSENGQEPPAFYLCWYATMTDDLWQEMNDYVKAHDMPLIPERVTDGRTKEAFLAGLNLKIISG